MQRQIVIIDLDGTLADITHRLHILKDCQKGRWERFWEGIPEDKPTAVVPWAQALATKYDIYVFSARSSATRQASSTWLAENGVPYCELLMRDEGDTRPDTEIKEMMLLWLQAEGREIAFVIDDRPQVVEMWKGKGLKVYPVNQGSWEEEK